MESFDKFADTCKTRTGAKSYSQMANSLGISRQLFNEYRWGKAIPPDHVVSQLATRADLDVDIALLWLNVWRAKEPARARYVGMIKSMTGIFVTGVLLANPLNKVTNSATPHVENTVNGNTSLYYEK